MAVAFEAVQSASGAAVSSLSTPSITPAGSNRLLVGVAGITSASPGDYTDMTYASGQMTPKVNYGPFQSFFRLFCEYLIAPSTGGGVVTVTLSGSTETVFVAALAFSGVDQTTPTDTEVTGNSNDGLATLTITSTTNDMAMDATIGFGGTLTKTGSGTERVNFGGLAPFNSGAGASTIAGAASVVQSWTYSAGDKWGSIGFNIKQVSAGASTPAGRAALLGVGM